MIHHIVMFRRKPDVAPDLVLEPALVARMQTLGENIASVRAWKFNANTQDRPICWDYVLESQFADTQGLHDYLIHPLHQALVEDLRPYFELAAVDYDA